MFNHLLWNPTLNQWIDWYAPQALGPQIFGGGGIRGGNSWYSYNPAWAGYVNTNSRMFSVPVEANHKIDISVPLYDQDGDGTLALDDCDDTDSGSTIIAEDGDCDDSLTADDCDDNDNTIYPGATEMWYDGVDQNCDGLNDYDQDGDGVDSNQHGGDDCTDTDVAIGSISLDGDCDGALTADDCDDTDPLISTHPTDDSDSDGIICSLDCNDNDNTSYAISVDGDCDGVASADDCDDTTAHLGAVTLDVDCDGALTADDCDDSDPGSTIVATDGDCDGVLTVNDCDDSDNTINQSAIEIWYDGVDQNCDGANDYDQDGDGENAIGYGSANGCVQFFLVCNVLRLWLGLQLGEFHRHL